MNTEPEVHEGEVLDHMPAVQTVTANQSEGAQLMSLAQQAMSMGKVPEMREILALKKEYEADEARKREQQRCDVILRGVEPAIDDREQPGNAGATDEAENDAAEHGRPERPQEMKYLRRQAVWWIHHECRALE